MMVYTSIMYHFIEDPASMKWSVTPQSFKNQIALIENMGVKTICVGDKMCDDAVPPCFITFDDGHRSNLKAAEILAEHNMRACFYVVKDYSTCNPNYLNASEIRTISQMGHAIGIHGKYHNWWTRYSDEQLVSDLRETKYWIEDITGIGVNTCSAVGGKIDKRVINCLRTNLPELKYIRTSKWGYNNGDSTLLNSIGITTNLSLQDFKKILILDQFYYNKGGAQYLIKELVKPLYHTIIGK